MCINGNNLFRISIEDLGCEKILTHSISQAILKKLIESLGCDNAGRGMNCAFAIGRDIRETDRILLYILFELKFILVCFNNDYCFRTTG